MAPRTTERPQSELYWFPFYVKDFQSSPDVLRMTDAEVGRYLRLLILAWGSGTREPSLEPDDLTGATARVKKQFTEQGDRLINRKLSAVWKVQRSKHDSAVKRGRKGGLKKAAGKPGPSSTTSLALAEGVDRGKQDALYLRESIDSLPVVPPTENGVGALAADAPRASEQRLGGTRRLGDVIPLAPPPRSA